MNKKNIQKTLLNPSILLRKVGKSRPGEQRIDKLRKNSESTTVQSKFRLKLCYTIYFG